MAEAEQVLAQLSQLHAEAIFDDDAMTATLHAAVFGEALRRDVTPRAVLDGLWQAAPNDAAWHGGFRDALRAALDMHD